MTAAQQPGSPRLGAPLPAFERAFGEAEARGLLLGRIVLTFRFGSRRLLALFTDGQAIAIRCHYGTAAVPSGGAGDMEAEARLFCPLDVRGQPVPLSAYQTLLSGSGWTIAVATCPTSYVVALQDAPL